MELRNGDDSWELRFENGVVQLIQIDFRLGLFMSDTSDARVHLHVGTACLLKCTDSEALLIPEETASLAPALPLFNAKVAGIEILKSGRLTVKFCENRSLRIDPHEKFEAWELGCPSIQRLFICEPGGGVTLFDKRVDGQSMSQT